MKFMLNLSPLILLVVLFYPANLWAKNSNVEEITLTNQGEKQQVDVVRQLLKQYRDNLYMFTDISPENNLQEQCSGLEYMRLIHAMKEKMLEQYPHWRGKRVKYRLRTGTITIRSSFVFSDWSQRVVKASEICADVHVEGVLPILHVYEPSEIGDLTLLRDMENSINNGVLSCMIPHAECKDIGRGTEICSASMKSEWQKAEQKACTCRKIKDQRAEFKEFLVAVFKKYPKWKNAIIHYIVSPYDSQAANLFLNFPFLEKLSNQTRCP
ncbi:MAG: hypothetical protein COB14_01425 [Alphaproteobacteria bacterium]|nr:MAG: hypothetical protein COB14_01425 [Alphaproteobacteria bacterium]